MQTPNHSHTNHFLQPLAILTSLYGLFWKIKTVCLKSCSVLGNILLLMGGDDSVEINFNIFYSQLPQQITEPLSGKNKQEVSA